MQQVSKNDLKQFKGGKSLHSQLNTVHSMYQSLCTNYNLKHRFQMSSALHIVLLLAVMAWHWLPTPGQNDAVMTAMTHAAFMETAPLIAGCTCWWHVSRMSPQNLLSLFHPVVFSRSEVSNLASIRQDKRNNSTCRIILCSRTSFWFFSLRGDPLETSSSAKHTHLCSS